MANTTTLSRLLLALAAAHLCLAAGCGEDSPFDHEDWSVVFLAPHDGAFLDGGSSTVGFQMDILIQAVATASDAGITLASARLQARPASQTTNAPPVLGEVDGGFASFRQVALPNGDVLLSASVTDDDRSTIVGSITVHVQ